MSESQNIEWKTSWRDDYFKWICGFANAQGGVLEVGKNDKGEVVGVKNVLRLLEEIPNKALALLGIVVDVNLKSEDGGEYIEIVVEPHPNPISYKGRIYYRSGSTKQVLKGAALSRFLLKKYGRTWDDAPLPGIRLKDLDRHALNSFRRRGAETKRLPKDILKESDGEVIERLQLREADSLKRAAVLLFHPRPHRFVMGAYVKIGYFRGSELLYQDVVEGNLFSQVDRTMDLLYSKYMRALISYDGVYRVETFPVPSEAMREAVINAVIHRDYASPTTIQIRVCDDRIMMWNAAQLPPEWGAVGLDGERPSNPHNPRIAYAFFRAGMMEAWGRGIPRITDVCAEAGNPAPAWELEPTGGLWVRFPFSAAYCEADAVASRRFGGDTGSDAKRERDGSGGIDGGKRLQENLGEETREETETTQEIRTTTEETIQEALPTTRETTQGARTTTQERILALLRAEPEITQRILAERIGITRAGVKYHITKLRASGTIRHVGATKSGRWEVLK